MGKGVVLELEDPGSGGDNFCLVNTCKAQGVVYLSLPFNMGLF